MWGARVSEEKPRRFAGAKKSRILSNRIGFLRKIKPISMTHTQVGCDSHFISLVNLLSGLIAYMIKPRKPALKLNRLENLKLLMSS